MLLQEDWKFLPEFECVLAGVYSMLGQFWEGNADLQWLGTQLHPRLPIFGGGRRVCVQCSGHAAAFLLGIWT